MTPDLQAIRAQERVGSILRGKWHLDELLGVGGMASVYAATHRNGSRAAAKIMHVDMASNEAVRERFLWEGYVANAVRHDGVVKVIDDDTDDDGSLYLVTELLDGETLEARRLRSGGRRGEHECLVAMDQVLDVLVAAHAAGIVHRDIKPDNLFLTREGRVKVLDFGIARLRGLPTIKNVTRAGIMLGTPAYMAPEQARGLTEEVDERSDLWSCGATMFCLLSGRSVHDGPNDLALLADAMTTPAPSLRSVVPEIDGAVADLVDHALEFSKELRWPTAVEMQNALHDAYGSRYGHPISAAPALVLGGGVPDRTRRHSSNHFPSPDQRDSASQRSAISSLRPVASFRIPRRGRTALVAGIAIGLGVAVSGVVSVAAVSHRRERAQQSLARAVSIPLYQSSPSRIAVPTMDVSDLPTGKVSIPEVQQVESPPIRVSATRSTGLRHAEVQVACRPPYVVDTDSGKKRWKMECL
jgi:serine/threonine-protein kinase